AAARPAEESRGHQGAGARRELTLADVRRHPGRFAWPNALLLSGFFDVDVEVADALLRRSPLDLRRRRGDDLLQGLASALLRTCREGFGRGSARAILGIGEIVLQGRENTIRVELHQTAGGLDRGGAGSRHVARFGVLEDRIDRLLGIERGKALKGRLAD